MKDNEIRGLILQYFYDRRRDGYIDIPEPNDFDGKISQVEINDIVDQLRQYNLIEWRQTESNGYSIFYASGKITARGVDVVEGQLAPPIAITSQQNITINQASGFQISNNNNINNHQ